MHESPIAGQYNWMRAVDVMTPRPLTVKPTDSIAHAQGIMGEHSVRQLPVVEGGELLGIVTDRDIRLLLGDVLSMDAELRSRALDLPVERIMSPAPLTLSPDDDLKTVVTALISDKVGGFPVVDKKGGLLGIVTYIDILRCFLHRLREN